jgi:hypothetical protein
VIVALGIGFYLVRATLHKHRPGEKSRDEE